MRMTRIQIVWTVIGLLAGYGSLTGFNASIEWKYRAFVVVPAVTLLAIPILIRCGCLRIPRASPPSIAYAVKVWIVTSIFGLFLCGLVVGRAIPAAGTYLLADDERVVVTVTHFKRKLRAGRNYWSRALFFRPYRVRIEIGPGNPRAEYTVDEDQYSRFEANVSMTHARIRRSWFGVHVLELEPTSSGLGSSPHIEF